MEVSELGEFGLIQRLALVVDAPAPEALIVGIGDDAAAWRAGDSVLLATTDTLVEGVHFLPEMAPWRDIGWKSMAVNVSDIAAMGGQPLFALVTLALPPETKVEIVEEVYRGLAECALEYSVTVAGGDIVRARQVSITIALIGRAEMRDGEPLILRRDTARPGDVIAVTGTLGDSAAGLRRLKEGAPPDAPLVRGHLRPRPPLRRAQEAARLGVVCGVDISDGLLRDIGHVCEMSKLAAVVRAKELPLSAELRDAFPEEAHALACTGGEDYQMAFAAAPELLSKLRTIGTEPLTMIGEMIEGAPQVRLVDEAGHQSSMAAAGWDHLRS